LIKSDDYTATQLIEAVANPPRSTNVSTRGPHLKELKLQSQILGSNGALRS